MILIWTSGHCSPVVNGSLLVRLSIREGTFEWVGLFNHSGQLNNALHAPIPVDDIRISIITFKPYKAARLLSNGKKLRVSKRRNSISIIVTTLKHYDIVLLEYE
jgi:hypothetical protein